VGPGIATLARRRARGLPSETALLAASLFLLLVLLRAPWLDEPRWNDSSVFETVTLRVLDGDALYTGVYDHKPPGIYFVYALAHAMAEATRTEVPLSARLLDSAAVAAGLAVLSLLLEHRRQRWWFAPGAGVILSGWDLYSGGALAESWVLLAAAIALTAAKRARWLLAGMGIGLGLAFSPVGVVAVPAVVAMAIGAGWPDRSARLAAGTAIPLLAGGVAILATGAQPGDAFDALITYNLRHAGAHEFSTSVETAARQMRNLALHTGLATFLLACALALERRRPPVWALVQLAVSAAVAIWLVSAGRVFGQSAFVAFGLGLAAAATLMPRSWPLALGAAVALLCFGRYTLQEEPWLLLRIDGSDQVERYAEQADGPIWVWGHYSEPVLDAGKTPAYRYFFNLPLLHYDAATRLEEAIAEALARPPALIIDECRVAGGTDPCLAEVDSPDLRGLLSGYDLIRVEDFRLYVPARDD
jgi:hypothetical protein